MYEQFRVTIKLSDFIAHSGQTADPLNEYTKALKQISGRRKKTEADFQQMADIEFRAGLYVNAANQPIIPCHVLEAAIAEGAKKMREGKQALSGMFVDTDMLLEKYDGGPLTVEQLANSPKHRRVDGVRVGQAKVMRTRPVFHNVEGSFIVSLNTEISNPSQLRTWIDHMMRDVGLGDWRPRHGRGELLEVEQIGEKPAKLRVA